MCNNIKNLPGSVTSSSPSDCDLTAGTILITKDHHVIKKRKWKKLYFLFFIIIIVIVPQNAQFISQKYIAQQCL